MLSSRRGREDYRTERMNCQLHGESKLRVTFNPFVHHYYLAWGASQNHPLREKEMRMSQKGYYLQIWWHSHRRKEETRLGSRYDGWNKSVQSVVVNGHCSIYRKCWINSPASSLLMVCYWPEIANFLSIFGCFAKHSVNNRFQSCGLLTVNRNPPSTYFDTSKPPPPPLDTLLSFEHFVTFARDEEANEILSLTATGKSQINASQLVEAD